MNWLNDCALIGQYGGCVFEPGHRQRG